jgi:hypothetical protein
MTSPPAGSTLPGASATFIWNTGTGATQYWLFVGTTGIGSTNILAENQGTNTSKTVTGLPTNGSTVYVRLWTLMSVGWEYNDYTYAAFTAPPSFIITLSQAVYTTGDTLTATEFRPKNPGAAPVPIHLKIWLNVPTLGEVVLIEFGADGSFSIPGNLDVNIGPVSVLAVTATFPPRGNWEWNSRIRNPSTTAVLYEEFNPFVVN